MLAPLHWADLIRPVTLLVALLALPQTPSTVAVAGIVQDQTGAVLPSATVELVNAAGAFGCARVAPGQYELRAGYDGFKPAAGVGAGGAAAAVLGAHDVLNTKERVCDTH